MTIFAIALAVSLIALAVVIRLLLDVASDVAALPEPQELPDVPEIGYAGDDCERY